MIIQIIASVGLVGAVVLCLVAVLGGPEINCEYDERPVHRPE